MTVYDLKDNHKKKGFSIQLNANGGSDMCGEWYFSGTYDFTAWDDYRLYQGYISKNKKFWTATIRCGYSGIEYTKLKETSLKKLKQQIEVYIKKERVFVKYYFLYKPTNIKQLIFKEINGVITWIATELDLKRAYLDTKVYGYGLFYTAHKSQWVKDRLDGFSFGKFENSGCCYISSGLKDINIINKIHDAIYNQGLLCQK